MVPRCLHTVFQSDMVISLSLGTLRVRDTTKMASRLCDSMGACVHIYGCTYPSEAVPTHMPGSPAASALLTFGTEVYSTGLLGLD